MDSSQEMLNESDDSKNCLIQEYCNNNYLWKIKCTEEQYPEKHLESINSLTTQFVVKFFTLGRAETSDLKHLGKELVRKLKEFICNINLNESEFLIKLEEAFNHFHSEIMSLQLEKTREILISAKNSFRFNQIYRRPIISDLVLEREENTFLTKMFETKNFTTENFIKEFVSTFKNFIEGYNLVVEKALKDYVERVMQSFAYAFERLLTEVRNRINIYLGDVISNFKPMRLSVMIYQLVEDENMQKMTQWEVVYEEYIHKESVYLKQVLNFSSHYAMICISFPTTNAIQFITNNNYQSRATLNMFPDSNSIIADGSTEDYLVIIQNTLKRSFIAHFYDDKIIINKEIPVFSETINEIKVACYLKSKNEIFIINQDGGLLICSVESNKVKTSTNQIPPTNYKYISLTKCERFVVLISQSEAYVFTTNLELVYMDHSSPFYASVRDNYFEMITLNSMKDIVVEKIPLDSEQQVKNPKMNNMVKKIDANFRKTLKLTSDLITGMLEDDHFGGINAPRPIPK
ncbi:hypothetical protein SteCoe_31231 [Stentor coeruleus]|uniref:Uncharacterized protein n=1 Tax=Stentor coeruleus TaxID=5963 RepID=A0A1R2B282_9CILI|nr:hypothetical protein SteCoe_31231 [Stentor coeruleus]